MFATDRDLLALEPRLFHDIAWSAQRLLDVTNASVNSAGTMLTIPAVDLAALGIAEGFVAVVAGVPLEVLERTSATTLTVSRLRAVHTEPPIPAAPGSNLKATISTFRPQISLVHDQMLRTIGIEPGEPSAPGAPAETDITNPRALILAESLGALHLIFSAAAALVSEDSPLWAKARMYRERFTLERRRLTVEIDLDADGEPDAIRRPNAIQFARG